MQRRVVTLKMTDVSGVRTASIIRTMMMEAVCTSETSVNFKVTKRRYIPDDSKLQYNLFIIEVSFSGEGGTVCCHQFMSS
jgi:hypothetical protein